MTCAALIGDPENGSPDEQQLEQQLRAMIELENISAFVFGYFGPFEQLALRVIQRLQKEYPLLDYMSAAYRDPQGVKSGGGRT